MSGLPYPPCPRAGPARPVRHNGAVSSPRPADDAAPVDGSQPGSSSRDQPGSTQGPPRARRRTTLLAGTALVALLLDVLTKVAAVATLEQRPPLKLLGGAVYLTLVRNSGAAFSMASGLTWLLTLVAIAVVVAIVRLAPRLHSPSWALGLGLVLGGALGNLVDRMLRAPGPLRGHVVDFVSLFAPAGQVWPVFNVADSAIVCGGILLVVLAATGRDYQGGQARPPAPPAPPASGASGAAGVSGG